MIEQIDLNSSDDASTLADDLIKVNTPKKPKKDRSPEKFLKCGGFNPQIENIYCNYPFQIHSSILLNNTKREAKFFIITNKVLKNDQLNCFVCSKIITLKKMRSHIAKHILNNQCVRNPCGYCGLLCNSVLDIKKSSGYGKNTNFKPHSNCVRFYAFSLAPVERIGTFCSNRPVVCKICRNIFWSYNMRSHYENFHQGANFD